MAAHDSVRCLPIKTLVNRGMIQAQSSCAVFGALAHGLIGPSNVQTIYAFCYRQL